MAETAIEQIIAEQDVLDQAAGPVQGAVQRVLRGAPALGRVLHGEWLGHPLHAALTDVPVGAWTTAFVIDLVEVFSGSRKLRRGADAAITIGLVGSLGAAVAGLADWSETRDDARRVGFVHGVTNLVIGGLYGASLLARSRRSRGVGIGLASAGYGLMLFSSWLGGQLAYQFGVGVRAAREETGRSRGEAEEEALPEEERLGEVAPRL